jgi:4-amino-4-deoxy-L-arabinose transferase-like glycosyltransferase
VTPTPSRPARPLHDRRWRLPFPPPLPRVVREHQLVVAIVLGGALVRLVQFGSIPPGLNPDEASLGYDAYAVLHHGLDRNSFHYPVMFVSWGSGMAALPGYLSTPFLLLFGLSPAPVRAVNLIAGILSIAVLYAFVRRSGDRTLAALAAFLLAISPWHIMMSRWALESNLFPALFGAGVYFLSRGWDGNRWLIVSGFFFALTLWTYGTSYVVTPLFLALVALSFFWHRRPAWKPAIAAAAVFFVIALPIIAFVIINQLGLPSLRTAGFSIPRLTIPRYQSSSTFFSEDPITFIQTNIRDLWHVLTKGDDGLLSNSISGFGYLYFVGFPLTCLGIIVTLAAKAWWRSQVHFFFVAWLVAALVLSVFALDVVNINRINILFIPMIFFAAVAIRELVRSRPVLIGMVVFFCLLFGHFTRTYFSWYRVAAEPTFQTSLGDAINEASRSTAGPLCITNRVAEPYIYVLFYRKIDPNLFVRSVRYVNPGAAFQQVASFGRYTFGLQRCDHDRVQGYVVVEDEQHRIDRHHFSFERFGSYVVARRRH